MVNKDIWNDTSDENKAVLTGCAELAEYAGTWRAKEYTGFTVNGLIEGGMEVAPAGDELEAELQTIGETMTEEWLEAAGDDGKAIMDAYQASK
ncbi:C4-dicarboxylate ABC transporter substrate-binding protein, partial [bacterium]|nr:C4-dicarboxylate ABC transporter substrate-binding protein [bacterium]